MKSLKHGGKEEAEGKSDHRFIGPSEEPQSADDFQLPNYQL